jgi:hypothetical protein
MPTWRLVDATAAATPAWLRGIGCRWPSCSTRRSGPEDADGDDGDDDDEGNQTDHHAVVNNGDATVGVLTIHLERNDS